MAEPPSTLIALGRRQLDCVRNVLSGDEGEVRLSPIAVRFLEVLAESPGVIVSRHALIDRLWDGNAPVGEPALNRVVSELRKTLGDKASSPSLVQTIPRRGYRLVVDEKTSPQAGVTRTRRWVWAAAVVGGALLAIGLLSWLGDTMIALAWITHNPG